MAGDLSSGFGEGSTVGPPSGGLKSIYSTGPGPDLGAWRAIALTAIIVAVISAGVSIAALIMILTRPTAQSSSTASSNRHYSAAEVCAAQPKLCDTYKLAAKAVQVDTNGNDKALAGTATTNAAVMLDRAAADTQRRDAARALAAAYLTATAKASNGVAADAEWLAALDDVIAKDTAMKNVCGN